MILRPLIFLFICQNVLCHPHPLNIPDKVQPAEVNSLQQHNHHPRSISHTPDFLSQNNVEETVKEVEAMLIANPTLPRLTRGEILDLLENITKTDIAKGKVKSKSEETKERDPKAIMVVMPFNPSNGNEVNMEELYTKPPVTHIVGAVPFKKAEDFSFKRIPPEVSSIPALDNAKLSAVEIQTDRSTSTSTATEIPAKPQYIAKKTGNRRRRPSSQSINLPTATPGPTTYHPSRRPIRRRTTTTERYPNHRYPDEVSTETLKATTSFPSNGIKIIDPPKFTASELNEDLIMQENRQGALSGKGEKDSASPKKKVTPINLDLKRESSTSSSLIDFVPDNLKGVLADINSQTKNLPTVSTTIKAPSKSEEEKIRDLLATFGVLALKTTTTTTTQVPDVSNVADNLTPEMRDLLMSFGLIPNANENKLVSVSTTTESFIPEKAVVEPEAYAGFKPLPDTYSNRDDMEEFLARFGLDRNSRKEKSLTKKREDKEVESEKGERLNFEAVPEEYMGVLKDIGFTDRQGKMIRTEPLVKVDEKQNVFNPGEPQYASNEELEKLTKLLAVVRQLEKLNGTVTEEDVKKIDVDSLKEIISSLNEENKLTPLDEQSAPNPVNFDLGLEKNEVKRQQNSTTTTESPSTSTAEVVTANLKDLEDSFGGNVDASPATEEPEAESTTQARKTGFYYLVDWNTFLDIDDQKGKRVNLRFQPKVGDPKRFYSVSVP